MPGVILEAIYRDGKMSSRSVSDGRRISCYLGDDDSDGDLWSCIRRLQVKDRNSKDLMVGFV